MKYRVNYVIAGYHETANVETPEDAKFWVKKILEQSLFNTGLKADICLTQITEVKE